MINPRERITGRTRMRILRLSRISPGHSESQEAHVERSGGRVAPSGQHEPESSDGRGIDRRRILLVRRQQQRRDFGYGGAGSGGGEGARGGGDDGGVDDGCSWG